MKIKGVIFDWAGTTVDFGCFAPVEVFLSVFQEEGIDVTYDEAREPMGMSKIDHIRTMLNMPRIQEAWEMHFNRPSTEEDVERLYASFEQLLMASLAHYTTPIPHVLEAVEALRKKGIRIGSTTGYTAEMMEVVAGGAAQKGYAPEFIATADLVGGKGRPYPYMIFENMKQLGLSSVAEVVKVGDTVSDVLEGVHAGVISVGVIVGSSEMGLSEEEYSVLSEVERKTMVEKTRARFEKAGAHYTIETMADLVMLIDKLSSEEVFV